MLKRFFLSQFITFITIAVYCQTYEYKQIFSTDELKDGADCFITCEKSSQLCDLTFTEDSRCEGVYDFKCSSKYKNISDLASTTQIFKIKKINDKFYLYVPERDAYVSTVDQSITSQTALYNMFVFTADARNEITIGSINNLTEMKIGNKYILFHRTVDKYRAMSNINNDYMPVKFYIIQEKGEDPILELNSDTDLKNTKFSGTIKFNRNFENGYFNTLVLPFAVNSPWEVFGDNVEIYEPITGNANEIGFKKLQKGESMTAYVPYLLYGTFNAAPYIIKNVSLSYNSVGTKLKTTVGEQILYSVFQKKQLGNTSNYVLYQNQLRPCQKVQSLYIEPYKWYLVTPKTKANSSNWEKIIYINTNKVSSKHP